MSYASEFSTQIYAYVDPSSGEAKSLFVSTPIGLTVREGGEWRLPASQAEVDQMTGGYDAYMLNWDKNLENTPEDVPDDYDEEHEAVYEFDKGELNLSNIEQYFDLAYKAGEGIPNQE
jgi:hypothetical protein